MNCVLCNTELGDEIYENEGTKLKLHKSCVTDELKEQIKHLLLGYLYINKEKLIRGFNHKPHEQI